MREKRISYVTMLSGNVRRRHEHVRFGKQVTQFLIQIEYLLKDQWIPVVRYDTAHGFAHRDFIFPNSKVEKTPLFTKTLNEALDFAQSDLKVNWSSYLERFLKEVKP